MTMEKLYLLATVAGQSIAIRAAAVESVVEIESIAPVPLAAPHVAGLAALRSKVLTIVCCERALGFEPQKRAGSKRAIVVEIDGHPYGLLVNTIEEARVIDAEPVPVRARLDRGWARVALGLLDLDGEAILLVDPARLVEGPAEMAA